MRGERGVEAAPPRLPKGLLVDNLGHCALVLSALAYFALFVGAVVAGALGPPIFSTASNPAATLSQSCPSSLDPASATVSTCTVTWFGTLTDMSPYHQFMWLNMNMARPQMAVGGPALPALSVAWGLLYQVDVLAIGNDGTRIAMAMNQTHVQQLNFAASAAKSSDLLLFYTQVRAGGRGGGGGGGGAPAHPCAKRAPEAC